MSKKQCKKCKLSLDESDFFKGESNCKYCQKDIESGKMLQEVKILSNIKEKIRLGDTVSIGSCDEEVGKVTEIKNDLIKIDFGTFSQWVSSNIIKKYKWG